MKNISDRMNPLSNLNEQFREAMESYNDARTDLIKNLRSSGHYQEAKKAENITTGFTEALTANYRAVMLHIDDPQEYTKSASYDVEMLQEAAQLLIIQRTHLALIAHSIGDEKSAASNKLERVMTEIHSLIETSAELEKETAALTSKKPKIERSGPTLSELKDKFVAGNKNFIQTVDRLCKGLAAKDFPDKAKILGINADNFIAAANNNITATLKLHDEDKTSKAYTANTQVVGGSLKILEQILVHIDKLPANAVNLGRYWNRALDTITGDLKKSTEILDRETAHIGEKNNVAAAPQNHSERTGPSIAELSDEFSVHSVDYMQKLDKLLTTLEQKDYKHLANPLEKAGAKFIETLIADNNANARLLAADKRVQPIKENITTLDKMTRRLKRYEAEVQSLPNYNPSIDLNENQQKTLGLLEFMANEMVVKSEEVNSHTAPRRNALWNDIGMSRTT